VMILLKVYKMIENSNNINIKFLKILETKKNLI
jgi:hypothetical protein